MPEHCLARELREELGIEAAVGCEAHRTLYEYGERALDLRFFNCEIVGEPQPLLGQQIRWVARDVLRTLEFPPADAELVDTLVRTG